MRTFTDINTVVSLLERSSLSIQDRYIIDAGVVPTLEERCGDIRSNELEKVKQIEENNIYQFLNVSAQVLGLIDNSLLCKLAGMQPLSDVIYELKKEYSGKELECVLIRVFIKYILSNDSLKIKIQGEMPQKLFSFRQMTGDEWFQSYVDFHTEAIIDIYKTMGLEDARAHLLANTAYQLYQVRPGRYSVEGKSDDEALKEILNVFLRNKGENPSVKFNAKNEVLFKDI